MPNHTHGSQHQSHQAAPTRRATTAPAPQPVNLNAPPNAGSLLQLQQMAGNRAVNRLLANPTAAIQRTPASGPPPITQATTPQIQRLPEVNVRSKFSTYNFEEVDPKLVKFIVDRTTKFENSIENYNKKLEAANGLLIKLDDYLSELDVLGKPIPTDEETWGKLIDEWAEPYDPKVQAKKEELLKEKKKLQKLKYLEKARGLVEHYKKIELPDVLSGEDRVLLEVAMGQGVAADLGKTILYSDKFSSCSGIFFFNSKNFKGGIYHFAANSYDQFPKLLEFVSRIKPTWIGIDRRVKPNPQTFMDRQDNEAANEQYDKIYEALKKTGAEIEEVPPSSDYYLYVNDEGSEIHVDSEGIASAIKVNLTDKTELPSFLTGFAGTDMLHNAPFYGEGFAKDY